LDTHPSSNGLQVMRIVMSIQGPSMDPANFSPTSPNARREWCIDTAIVDPATDSILENSEDGTLYRWNLATNTLSQAITLTPGLGQAYTPTAIGPDGTVYAIQDSGLYAVGAATSGVHVSLVSSLDPSTFGQSVTLTAHVTSIAPLTGTPTGTVTFTDG